MAPRQLRAPGHALVALGRKLPMECDTCLRGYPGGHGRCQCGAVGPHVLSAGRDWHRIHKQRVIEET